jgi:hypothetical protein
VDEWINIAGSGNQCTEFTRVGHGIGRDDRQYGIIWDALEEFCVTEVGQ